MPPMDERRHLLLLTAAGALVVLGGGALALFWAGRTRPSISVWAWVVAWTAFLGGVLMFGYLWGHSRQEQRPPRARYRMEPVVYNEGRCWLRLTRTRGGRFAASIRCEVQTPFGERY